MKKSVKILSLVLTLGIYLTTCPTTCPQNNDLELDCIKAVKEASLNKVLNNRKLIQDKITHHENKLESYKTIEYNKGLTLRRMQMACNEVRTEKEFHENELKFHKRLLALGGNKTIKNRKILVL